MILMRLKIMVTWNSPSNFSVGLARFGRHWGVDAGMEWNRWHGTLHQIPQYWNLRGYLVEGEEGTAVDHPDDCNASEESDELQGVRVELEENLFRVKNRPHEASFCRGESCKINYWVKNMTRFYLVTFNTIFVSSHMYPENPEGTRVIKGSMNLGYDIYSTPPELLMLKYFIFILPSVATGIFSDSTC